MQLFNFLNKTLNNNNNELSQNLINSSKELSIVLEEILKLSPEEMIDPTKTMPLLEKSISFQSNIFKIIHNLSLESMEFIEFRNLWFLTGSTKSKDELVKSLKSKINSLESELKNSKTKDQLSYLGSMFNDWVSITRNMSGNLNSYLEEMAKFSKESREILK